MIQQIMKIFNFFSFDYSIFIFHVLIILFITSLIFVLKRQRKLEIYFLFIYKSVLV